MAAYTFETVTRAHLSMLGAWLHQRHVRAWWGAPDDEARLIRGDIDNPLMDLRLVSLDGQPFAFVQDYALDDWPQPHLGGHPPGTRAMDTFIGPPEMAGQGHGARYLRIRARALLAGGAPRVVIDPEAANTTARRAYARAGFRGNAVVRADETDVVVMVFHTDP